MMKSIFFRIVLFLILTFGFKAYSQYTNIPLGYDFNNFLGNEIHQNVNHTSFKPLIVNSVNISIDSLIEFNFYSHNRILSHRFFNKHLIRIKGQDILLMLLLYLISLWVMNIMIQKIPSQILEDF